MWTSSLRLLLWLFLDRSPSLYTSARRSRSSGSAHSRLQTLNAVVIFRCYWRSLLGGLAATLFYKGTCDRSCGYGPVKFKKLFCDAGFVRVTGCRQEEIVHTKTRRLTAFHAHQFRLEVKIILLFGFDYLAWKEALKYFPFLPPTANHTSCPAIVQLSLSYMVASCRIIIWGLVLKMLFKLFITKC